MINFYYRECLVNKLYYGSVADKRFKIMKFAFLDNLYIRIKQKLRTVTLIYKLFLHAHNILFYFSFVFRYCAESIMAFLLGRSLPHCQNFGKIGLFKLHQDLNKLLKKQRKCLSEEEMYLHGISQYQGLELLQIPGARVTEERFKEYGLYTLLSPNDRILDLGCNNGFLLIYASYIFGCRSVGVDHNEFTIKAGERCIDFLNLQDLVTLHAKTIENYIEETQNADRFSVVISFATHHTIDGGIKKGFNELFSKGHSLLSENGLFLFETHMSHSDDSNFNEILSEGNEFFDYVDSTYLDYIQRRFVVFLKKGTRSDTKNLNKGNRGYLQIIKALQWDRLNARYCYNSYVKLGKEREIVKKIGFIIPSATFLHHFFPIFKHLSNDKFICIPLNSSVDDTEDIYKFCAENNIPILGVKEMFSRGIIFDTLVSNAAPIGLTPDSDLPEVKSDVLRYLGINQVKIMYAGGKVGWNYDEWNREYKYVLCYGPYYSERYRKKFPHLKTIDVGYPRLDQLYSDFSKSVFLENIGLDPEKKTISCLFTHGDPEAYELLLEILPNLAAYNVLIKPHPFTVLDNSDYDYDHCVLLEKDVDNIDCYKVADFVLANYGGPLMAAIYADIDLLIIRSRAHEANYPENYSDETAPEIIVHRELGAFESSQVKNMLEILENEEFWSVQRAACQKLKKIFFRHSKESGKFSAQVIMDIMSGNIQ